MDMELETLLRPPARKMDPYPAKVITLATGKQMVVRQVDRKVVPTPLDAVRPLLKTLKEIHGLVRL